MSQPDWSRELRRPLKILTVMDASDARGRVAECRERDVANQLAEAARGGDVKNVEIALQLVLQLAPVPCLPQ